MWVWNGDNTLFTEQGWNKCRWDAAGEFPNSLAWNADVKAPKGTSWINVVTSSMSQDDWDKMEIELEKSVPAFFRVYVGYISSGVFVIKLTLE